MVLLEQCPSEQKGRKELAGSVISGIAQIDKKTLVEKLAIELPVLRAKMGISQAELGELIGVSRQTYSMIETLKKEMGWSVYMSLILVFSSNSKTASLLEFCGAFPGELKDAINTNRRG